MRKALIFGITGQDGILLSDILIKKKYNVHGLYRNKKRAQLINNKVKLIYKKHLNKIFIEKKILELKPHEIYFLIGKSSSYDAHLLPLNAIHANFTLFTYIVESVKKYCNKCQIFYASSSEIFGKTNKKVSERSERNPQNPYALAKHLAMEYIKFNRKIYNLNINTGILFNHDSKFRNTNNVLTKVINYLNAGKFKNKLQLGFIKIFRDWGLAEEYVNAIYKINQNTKGDDYIIASGKVVSLEALIKYAFKIKKKNYMEYIKINNKMFQGKEIKFTCGNINKIQKKFGWKPKKNLLGFLNQRISN